MLLTSNTHPNSSDMANHIWTQTKKMLIHELSFQKIQSKFRYF